MSLKASPFKRISILVLLGLWIFHSAFAQAPANAGNDEAAANAANPLAFVTKLQFQPNFTFKNGGGDQLTLISRIIQPSASMGLPFIESKNAVKIYTIYRIEFPVVSQTFQEPDDFRDATGLGDMVLLYAIVFKQEWGLLGVGPSLILPTGTSRYLGAGKWSAGLVAVALYTKIPRWQLGIPPLPLQL